MYVNKGTCNDCGGGGGGTSVQLNQKQYIIKGMTHGMGIPLVVNKLSIITDFTVKDLPGKTLYFYPG